MDEAIGNLDSDNQGVLMGVVYLTRNDFGKDDVIWLWSVAHWELGACFVHRGLRWFL